MGLRKLKLDRSAAKDYNNNNYFVKGKLVMKFANLVNNILCNVAEIIIRSIGIVIIIPSWRGSVPFMPGA